MEHVIISSLITVHLTIVPCPGSWLLKLENCVSAIVVSDDQSHLNHALVKNGK